MYLIYAVLVVLFLIPLVLSLSKDASISVWRGVTAIVRLPFWVYFRGRELAAANYRKALPITVTEYAALLGLLLLNALILVFGMTGNGSATTVVGCVGLLVGIVLVALHYMCVGVASAERS